MTARRGFRRENAVAGALILPSLAGVLLFVMLPLGVVVWLSTQSWNLIGSPRFVGADNVVAVLGDPSFVNSLLVTLLLAAVVVPVQMGAGLLLAVLLLPRRRGNVVFRTILVLPWVSAPLALGVVWNWIFAPTGGLVSGIAGHRVEWLVDPVGAFLIVAFVLVWGQAGYIALFYLAGLIAIPPEYAEAARLDGAGRVALLRHVTIPLLRPTTLFVLVTSTAQIFATFDQVYALTGGGPGGATDVLALRLFTEAFRVFDLGRAAVIALVLLALVALVSAVQWRYFERMGARRVD